MSGILQGLVDWLQANGVEGWVVVGGVTFHYVSLATGAILGTLFGWLTA